jgi:uncharacterized protein
MLWTALTLGFLGSFHCIGMCGPIALSISAQDKSRYLTNKISYNVGRMLTYMFLGLIIGGLGLTFSLAGFQQGFSILMGVLIILMAFVYKKSESWVNQSFYSQWVRKLKDSLRYFLKKGGKTGFFVTGVMNGFLPCGMVYIALMASLAFQNPLDAAMYMGIFGLGTFPALLVVMISGQLLKLSWRKNLIKAMPAFAFFIGVLFILRGMGLGIHMLSPHLPNFGKNTAATEMTVCP